MRLFNRKLALFFNASLMMTQISVAQGIPPLCTGEGYLLSMVNAGGNTQSPCTAYANHVIAELDYYYQNYYQENGYFNSYPDALLRLGIDKSTEINIAPPSLFYRSRPSTQGNSATILGGKHELWYVDNQLLSMAASLGLPDGSADFGNAHYSGELALLYGYRLNDSYYFNLALDYMRITESRIDGANLFTTLLGRASLSYFPNHKFGVYGEVYGQNKTAVNSGFGANTDLGFLYLITPKIVFNLSIGQRLVGNLEAIKQFYTAGIAIEF